MHIMVMIMYLMKIIMRIRYYNRFFGIESINPHFKQKDYVLEVLDQLFYKTALEVFQLNIEK